MFTKVPYVFTLIHHRRWRGLLHNARLLLLASMTTGAMMSAASNAAAEDAGASSEGAIENLGQIAGPVRYYSFIDGGTLYFTDEAIVFDMDQSREDRGHAVWMRFADASSPARIETEGTMTPRFHYFLGNDPARWRTEVTAHEIVIYRDVWPGIDVRFTPGSQELSYELVVTAGANAALAQFQFDGIGQLTRDENGRAVGGTSERIWVEVPLSEDGRQRSLSWHPDHGPGTIPSSGESRDNPSSILWSTFFGGSAQDRPHGLLVDALGTSYVTGYTRSSNLPTTVGAYDRSQNGEYDVYVARFSATGGALLWSTFLGGVDWDRAFAIRLDAANNVVVAGLSFSPDFPATAGAYDVVLGGLRDAFAAKLSPNGSALLWATYLGGSGTEWGWDMILDDQDRPIVVGETISLDFPTTPGAYDETVNNSPDGFISKLEADGSALIWSTVLGGSSSDQVTRVLVASDGSPVLAGNAASSNFPTTIGAFDETPNGGQDAFVAKLDPAGANLVFSTVLGGPLDDWGNGLALAPSGEAVIAGSTSSPGFPVTAGAYDETHNGMQDVFVARLDILGQELIWSTLIGGSENDEPFAFILDAFEFPILSGQVDSNNWPTTPDAFDLSYNGGGDAYLTRLDPSGSQIIYSTFLGGGELDQGWELYLHPSGDPILAGPTYSDDFPTTAGAYDQTHGGGTDVFLARFTIVTASDVDDEAGGQDSSVLRITPNPLRQQAQVRFALPHAAQIEATVWDVAGRRVAGIDNGWRAAGPQQISWDGRDDRGRLVASGTYWIRVEWEGATQREKVTVAR